MSANDDTCIAFVGCGKMQTGYRFGHPSRRKRLAATQA